MALAPSDPISHSRPWLCEATIGNLWRPIRLIFYRICEGVLPPAGLPNLAYRQREYLTEKEVDRLIEAARKRGRNGARDAAAILLAYRHGLRASELCSFGPITQLT